MPRAGGSEMADIVVDEIRRRQPETRAPRTAAGSAEGYVLPSGTVPLCPSRAHARLGRTQKRKNPSQRSRSGRYRIVLLN
jgi:hypothetical protein